MTQRRLLGLRSASRVSSARSGTHSSASPGRLVRRHDDGEVHHARRCHRAAPGCRRAPRPGATHSTAPSTGRSRLPATTSTRVAGSAIRSASQASSVRWSPIRLWAWAERATCGRRRSGVTLAHASRALAASVAAVSTHIGAQPGDIAPTVLLPGDPLRAKWIAETFLDDARCYSEVRGMYGFTGTWNGHPVSVQGSGMGQPSMAIYVNELFTRLRRAVHRPGRLVRRGDRARRGARRHHRLRRVHRLLDEPDRLPRHRLRPGRRLRPAARRGRGGRGRATARPSTSA